MKIINEKYNRYGEKDYDVSYINWGFDDLEYQIDMAEKLQKIFPLTAKSILDVACGISRYHQVWLKSGLDVTGIDLSETFINYSEDYNKDFLNAHYQICNFNNLNFKNEFDVVIWTDPVELTGNPVNRIYKALKAGGMFIYEMWNENYYKYHNSERFNECQTWSCQNNVYRLVRHTYNRATSTDEHEEIIFDVSNDTMIHKTGFSAKNVNSHCSIQILEAAGFTNVRFVDYDGQSFNPENDHVKQFFMIGEK